MADRRWLPLNALRAFEAVGRHGSFTAGAAALNVSQSAISRHVISLEAMLGAPLFDRRPQRLTATESGARLLPVVTHAFDRMQQALDAASAATAQPRTLRIHVPPSFAQLLAVPILRGFRAECPGVLLDIVSGSGIGLPPEVDAALTYAKPQAGEGVSDLLWMEEVTPLCCPEVARRHAGLALGGFLAANEPIHVKFEHERRTLMWDLFARLSGVSMDTARGLAFDTAALAAQYALSGEGVALLDPVLFAAEIAAGRLVAPYAERVPSGYGYFVEVQPEDLGDPAIARFRSWMIQRFGAASSVPQRPRLHAV